VAAAAAHLTRTLCSACSVAPACSRWPATPCAEPGVSWVLCDRHRQGAVQQIEHHQARGGIEGLLPGLVQRPAEIEAHRDRLGARRWRRARTV
jgi:hypothetical protein